MTQNYQTSNFAVLFNLVYFFVVFYSILIKLTPRFKRCQQFSIF